MARNTNTSLCTIDALETRSLYSASPSVIGYLPDYEVTPARLSGMDWSALTQINYFSVKPNAVTGAMPGTGSQPAVSSGKDWSKAFAPSYADAPNYDLSQLSTVVNAAKAHNVRVDIVVGGAALDAELTAIVGGSQSLQNAFADSVKTFAAKYGVGGVDLDWEPANPTAAQIKGYGNLIAAIKTRAPGIEVTAAVAAEPLWLAPGYNTQAYVLDAQAVRNLDTINVMAYDLGNPGDGAPIARAQADVTAWGTYVTQCQTQSGQNFKGKVTFGLPFYGRATTLANIDPNNPWDGVTNANTSTAGYGAIVTAAGVGSVPTSTASSANLSVRASVADTFEGRNSAATWNFDGRGTIAAKTQFALQNGFGGVMIWALGEDYFTPGTGTTDANVSLMPALKEAYTAVVGHAPNAPVVVTVPPAPTPAPAPAPVPTPAPAPTPTPVGTGKIAGSVWFDSDRDGSWGETEVANPYNRTVFLDANNNGVLDAGERNTTTDQNGYFEFENVAAGTQAVRLQEFVAYFSTTPISQQVTVAAGRETDVFFGEWVTYRSGR